MSQSPVPEQTRSAQHTARRPHRGRLAHVISLTRSKHGVLHLLRYHRAGHFLLAIAVGLVAGVGAVLFHIGIDAWTEILTGASDYTLSMGPSLGVLSWAGRWFVVVAPVISGIIIGPLMYYGGSTSTGHGVGGVMWSARRSDGTMRPRPAIMTTIASSLTIGGGGSVGPEGPISELGAASAALVGRRLGLPVRSVRMLAAAGTAAGIAAAFNAPLAGAFFALEVVLLDFTTDAFAFVVLACVSSTVLSHHLLGTTLSLSLPTLNLSGDTSLGWVAVLGLLGGVVGVLFSRTHFVMHDAVDHLCNRIHLPAWARPATGGLVLGGILLAFPEMYGESSAVLDRALGGRYTVLMLLALVVVKIIATSWTLASGFVGGVFAPSLFIGGALGAAFGAMAMPDLPSAPAIFGVLGMGAVFTGAARAPMTAVILIIEMTSQYELLVPLMLIVVLSTATSRFLTRTTIYTEELRRRGMDVDDPMRATLVGRVQARTIMHAPPALLDAHMTLAEAASTLASSGSQLAPVIAEPVDPHHPIRTQDGTTALGVLVGCVSSLAIAQAAIADADRQEHERRCVGDLALDPHSVSVTASSTAVLGALVSSHSPGLPVTESGPHGERVLVGWVDQQEMVHKLYRHQRRAMEEAQMRTSLGAQMQSRWKAWREAR